MEGTLYECKYFQVLVNVPYYPITSSELSETPIPIYGYSSPAVVTVTDPHKTGGSIYLHFDACVFRVWMGKHDILSRVMCILHKEH